MAGKFGDPSPTYRSATAARDSLRRDGFSAEVRGGAGRTSVYVETNAPDSVRRAAETSARRDRPSHRDR